MSTLLEQKLRYFSSDYVTFTDLGNLLLLTGDALRSQIKRALRQGYLTRLRKGLYRRGSYLEKDKVHPFEMSQHIQWPSYISLESALSYYGLIPEAIYTTTSVTSKRSFHLNNAFGAFSYHSLSKSPFFLEVTRKEEDNHIFFIATPWKALLDYIYCYKKDWHNITPLTESLRLDITALPPLGEPLANKFSKYYRYKKIDKFLQAMMRYYQNEY